MSSAIALFGGSFNPIHNGHIEIAKQAFELFNLEKIIFLPANISPLKAPSLSLNKNERLKMLKIALEGYPFFSISTYELEKSGKSLTIDTVRHFLENNDNKKYYFLMGEDSFESITLWDSFEKIFQLIDIIVYPRKNYSIYSVFKKLSSFQKVETNLKNVVAFKSKFNNFIYYLSSPILKNSSSKVRADIKSGCTSSSLVQEEVFAFIKSHNLYKKD